MANFIVSGIDQDLGDYNSGLGFLLTRFENATISFGTDGKKSSSVDVKKVTGAALDHIEAHCASSNPCNKYFESLNKNKPITLAKILDSMTLHIFRLKSFKGDDLKALPAALTFSWAADFARIGLNELAFYDPNPKMALVAVLLHELAHVAGAPGRRDTTEHSLAAEIALVKCGIKKSEKEIDQNAWG